MDKTNPRKCYQDRYAALKSEAENWKPAWRDIKDYIAPRHGFFDDIPNQGRRIDHTKIINGHAQRSINTLASGMTSGLTSPSRPWFRLGLADPDMENFEPVRTWLNDVQNRMLAVYAKSNIYGVLHSVYQECGAFGTAACLIMPDYKDVIRGRNFTIGEYYLGTGADNRVNAFGRRFWMTVAQLIEEFGEDNVSPNLLSGYKANPGSKSDQWVAVIHVVERNKEYSHTDKVIGNKPYASVYWEEGANGDKFLRKAGFYDFPILAPRWSTTTTADVYGRGPGWDALGDVKMLQKMEMDKLKALDKVVDPPMQADSSIEEVNLLPGGITRYSAAVPNAGVKPLFQANPDFNAVGQAIQKTEGDIDRTFYADLFMMIALADRPNMTAREIVERHEEKLLMLGPVLEALESELLDPLIDRTFAIMLRAGLIPPAPEELQGADLRVEYISLLAQAQKMVGTTAIEQLARFTGSLVAVYPESADVFNPDAAIQNYGSMLGVPPKVIRSEEEIAAMRQQRDQDEQAERAASAIPQAVSGAKVLADTKLGTNSALDELLAGVGGGSAPDSAPVNVPA